MNNKVLNVSISNGDKVVYKNPIITKLDVAKYYKEVSKKIIPFLRDSPISVIRCHNGINGDKFFKKHPAVFEKVERFKNKSGLPYFYLKDESQLIYQVQMGSLEFHTWASSITNINSPDIMVFDLDPDEEMSNKKLINSVLKLKKVLDDLNLVSFLKTSGGKGYHIVIPFKEIKNYDIFYNFAVGVAKYLETEFSDLFTTNIRTEDRKNKIFIDYLRNKKGATCVCPYSLRARKNAPISMPISWKDIDCIKPNQINLNNYKGYFNNAWNKFFKIYQTLK